MLSNKVKKNYLSRKNNTKQHITEQKFQNMGSFKSYTYIYYLDVNYKKMGWERTT